MTSSNHSTAVTSDGITVVNNTGSIDEIAVDDITITHNTARPDTAAPPQRLLFIAGWGRSGSTLFANILGAHPSVQNLGEFRYLWARGLNGTRCGCGDPVTNCDHWVSVLDDADWKSDTNDLDRFDQAVGSNAIFRQLRALLTRSVSKYQTKNREDIDQMVSLLNASAASLPNGRAAKVLLDSSKSIPFLANLSNDPRFDIEVIHLTRDPRAVAYSWSRLTDTQDADGVTFPRFGPIRSSIYWTIFNLAPLLFPNITRHQLAYEDFVSSPRETIKDICERFDLDMDTSIWSDDSTVQLDAQHTISGNPSRFRVGPIEIREDDRWRTQMRRRDRWVVSALTAPARVLLSSISAGRNSRKDDR